MYEVLIGNGEEKIISGTDREIKKYYIFLLAWHKRRYLYWIFFLVQILPLSLLPIFSNVNKICYFIAILTIFAVHTILWRKTAQSYPYEHPIYNLIKKHLLIKGKCVMVISTCKDGAANSAIEYIRLGYYKCYEHEKKQHVVTISKDNDEYFLFHQIIPVDSKRKKTYEPRRFDCESPRTDPLKCFGGFSPQDSGNTGNQ